jgi:hypothetical protein
VHLRQDGVAVPEVGRLAGCADPDLDVGDPSDRRLQAGAVTSVSHQQEPVRVDPDAGCVWEAAVEWLADRDLALEQLTEDDFRVEDVATVIGTGSDELMLEVARICPAVAIIVTDEPRGVQVFP